MTDDQFEQRRQITVGDAQIGGRPSIAAGGVERGEIELLVAGVKRRKEIKALVMDFLNACVRPINLVDHDDWTQALLQRLGDHKFGLRHRAFCGVDKNDNAIDHAEDPLHLATEIGMAWGIDDIEANILPDHRRTFCKNCDAALTLQVVGVHRPLGNLLVGAERARLTKQGIDQGCFPVIDVGDDGDVTNIHRNHK